MQVYAAGLVYNTMRVAQSESPRSSGSRLKRSRPQSSYPEWPWPVTSMPWTNSGREISTDAIHGRISAWPGLIAGGPACRRRRFTPNIAVTTDSTAASVPRGKFFAHVRGGRRFTRSS